MENNNTTPSTPFTCMHEEQIQGISRKIERIDAELGYKREKLDILKEDNRRMEEKIDKLQDCMNKLMLKSTTDDDKIENRLTAIETRLDTQEKIQNKNRDDTNLKIAIIGIILVLVQIYFNYFRH